MVKYRQLVARTLTRFYRLNLNLQE